MEVRIIALTSKGEEALRKYIEASQKTEAEINALHRFHPKRLKFNMDQKVAKQFITEESFDNPLMIVAKINPKHDDKAYMFMDVIKNKLNSIMLKSNCGKEDYNIEVL